ncbi:glycosyltransferase family 39 protein [Streptomyces sp. NPDC020490]|uniref:glycosyltransferase family 39 protein n=1 Tax=Streptomyces sp. NPDC020490 TaxID=3365078 RepID=UPI0037947249
MLAIGLWGLDRGGIWGDEGVTFLVGQRSVPQIWRFLHGMDAVHGLYYLLMHAVLAVRPDEVVLRLPSVCGAAAAAGLVAALGVRLARPRVGLWAGLLYAVTPLTGHYAQEGRSYALVAAGVAAATLLLVRALEARPSRWLPYGTVVAVTCLLHELAVLALCAHAVTLALLRAPGRVWAGWGRAAGAAGLVLLPQVWVSRRQSAQVAWLVAPGWEQAGQLLRDFAVAPHGPAFWAAVLLMAAGLGAGRTGAVAGPLLLVPPGVLMILSQVRPLYHERYVLYALAGASLLVAAGADRCARAVVRPRPHHPSPVHPPSPVHAQSPAHPPRPARAPYPPPPAYPPRTVRATAQPSSPRPGTGATPGAGAPPSPAPPPSAPPSAPPGAGGPPSAPPRTSVSRAPVRSRVALAGVLAVGVVFVHHLPLYRYDRSAAHRPENLAAVAAVAAREIRPGDPVLFVPSVWRLTALAYPQDFSGARDVALRESGPASGTLSGLETTPEQLRDRLASADRVWVLAETRVLSAPADPGDPTDRAKLALVGEQFEPRAQYVRGRVTLRLYVRRAAQGATSAPPAPPAPRPSPARR